MSRFSDQSLQRPAPVDVHSIVTFLGHWLRAPVKTASVTPSGRQLTRLMVGQLSAGCSRVVELGAGTGVFTRALLDAGIEPRRLLVVEINPGLAEFLRERFPDVKIACSDARHLDRLVREHDPFEGGKPEAVLSGLGMLTMSSALRCEILRAAFAALGDDGCFVQFTYGPFSPVRRHEREALGLRVEKTGFALRNLPPASVYVYRRLHSRQITPIRQMPRP